MIGEGEEGKAEGAQHASSKHLSQVTVPLLFGYNISGTESRVSI